MAVPNISQLVKRLTGDFAHTMGEGFHRSVAWIHVVGAFGALATDILKPYFGHVTLGILIAAVAGGAFLWWSIHTGRIAKKSRRLAATGLAFVSIVAAICVVLFGLQVIEGDPDEGSLTHSGRKIESELVSLLGLTHKIEAQQQQLLNGQGRMERYMRALGEKKGVPVDVLAEVLAR